MHSHPQTNRFNVILQFPVMQNTAATVFQGEAEQGWPCLPHGASPGPVCSLRRRPSVEGRPWLRLWLPCPVHIVTVTVRVRDFFIKSLCSVLRSLSLCSSALWPLLCRKICRITHKKNSPSNRNTSLTGTVA